MRKLTLRSKPWEIEGFPDYLASLLHARGVSDAAEAKRFLYPDKGNLQSPFDYFGMQAAVELVLQAKEHRQTVVVYGDYDADGVCASAIVLETLEGMGITAFSYIPERLTEGYGLHLEAIEQLARQAKLLITVDCGITAVQEIKRAQELGMKVIVSDHHALQGELPPADAILHPQLSQDPDIALCGAGVAWQLARALIGEKANKSLELTALATVADMVPLLGQNRLITSLGLYQMSKLLRPGIRALAKVSGIKTETISADQVAFLLAPRLNAGGRLASAQEALQLLLTRDQDEADMLAQTLDQHNRDRRQVEQQVIREASAMLQQQDLRSLRSIVLAGEGWNSGVVGLAAGRLAERWNYPCVVLTANEEGYTGSGRSAGGVDLFLALKACQHLFTRFGGHAMAAGLSLPKENLDGFRRCFDQAVKDQLGREDLIPETFYDSVLPLDQVNLKTAQDVQLLAPFGIGNPKPQFLLEDLKVLSAKGVGSDGAHLKLTVAKDNAVREGIAFSQGSLADSLSDFLRLVAAVDENHFNGKTTAQLIVKTILQSPGSLKENQRLEAAALLLPLTMTEREPDLPSVNRVQQAPPPVGTRGTLYLAYLAETANRFQSQYPELMLHTSYASDPRAFHCIVYAPDWQKPFASFERLVFLDGIPGENQAILAFEACNVKEIFALQDNPAIRERLLSYQLSVDELRQSYVRLRRGDVRLFPENIGKELAALLILRELNLISLDDTLLFAGMLPMTQVDPKRSVLFHTLSKL